MSIARVPVIKRGRMVWDREKLPESELWGRIEALRALARGRGLRGVLVYGNPLTPGNICYFTNYACHIAWRDGFLVLPVDGAPTMLLKVAARDVPYIQEVTPVKVRACGDLSSSTIELLQTSGLDHGNLGLVGEKEIPHVLLSTFRWELAGTNWINLDPEVCRRRQVKSARERVLLQEGAHLTSKVGALIGERMVPGVSLRSLEAEADHLARRAGCEDFQLLVGVGDGETGPVSDYVLRQGDRVRILVACQLLRYWTAMARTMVCGSDTGYEDGAIVRVREIQDKLVRSLNPCTFAREAFKDLSRQACGKIGLGSGIGLELEEAPDPLAEDFCPSDGLALCLRLSLETAGQKTVYGDTILLEQGQTRLLTGV